MSRLAVSHLQPSRRTVAAVSSNVISVTRLSKSFPERPVLDDVTFGVDEGDHLGVIGYNGAGKSTLLGLLSGQINPDSGTIVTRSGLAIAHLRQTPVLSSDTSLRALAATSHATLTYLDRLGITDLDTSLGELSGGQQRRVALALTLAEDSDVLILDEPTNHLDIDAIDWLEEELARRSQTVIFVTHDRYLLDRLATRILEVEAGRVYTHPGTYQAYLQARETRREHAERTERSRRNLAKVELEWLRRSPKARTSKSKARVTRATELQISRAPDQRVELAYELPSQRLGDKVVDIERASVGFDGLEVLSDISWNISRGSRIGIVGPNGAGKTTLLRLLGGRVSPTGGSVSVGDTVVPGWYGQEPEDIKPSLRLIDAIREQAEQTKLTSGVLVSASQLLERMGFPSTQHSALVSDLSGGERRRLELLRVLAGAPNLLLLDEPTNDLDLETLGSLEALLDNWPGAVITATHDRYFLERVCRDVISVERDGSIKHHPAGYAAYLEDRKTEKAGASGRTPQPPGRDQVSGRGQDRLSYHEQRELQRLETVVAELSKRLAEVDGALEVVGSDWESASRLSGERAEIQAALAAAEDRWLELSDRR